MICLGSRTLVLFFSWLKGEGIYSSKITKHKPKFVEVTDIIEYEQSVCLFYKLHSYDFLFEQQSINCLVVIKNALSLPSNGK